jgi:hypothetical protein
VLLVCAFARRQTSCGDLQDASKSEELSSLEGLDALIVLVGEPDEEGVYRKSTALQVGPLSLLPLRGQHQVASLVVTMLMIFNALVHARLADLAARIRVPFDLHRLLPRPNHLHLLCLKRFNLYPLLPSSVQPTDC